MARLNKFSNDSDITNLFFKYINGDITDDEKKRLFNAIGQNTSSEDGFMKILNHFSPQKIEEYLLEGPRPNMCISEEDETDIELYFCGLMETDEEENFKKRLLANPELKTNTLAQAFLYKAMQKIKAADEETLEDAKNISTTDIECLFNDIKEEDTDDLIDAYLSGELSEDEEQKFKERLSYDEDFKKRVSAIVMLSKSINTKQKSDQKILDKAKDANIDKDTFREEESKPYRITVEFDSAKGEFVESKDENHGTETSVEYRTDNNDDDCWSAVSSDDYLTINFCKKGGILLEKGNVDKKNKLAKKDTEEETTKKDKGYIRYIATAAIVLGLIAGAGWLFYKENDKRYAEDMCIKEQCLQEIDKSKENYFDKKTQQKIDSIRLVKNLSDKDKERLINNEILAEIRTAKTKTIAIDKNILPDYWFGSSENCIVAPNLNDTQKELDRFRLSLYTEKNLKQHDIESLERHYKIAKAWHGNLNKYKNDFAEILAVAYMYNAQFKKAKDILTTISKDPDASNSTKKWANDLLIKVKKILEYEVPFTTLEHKAPLVIKSSEREN